MFNQQQNRYLVDGLKFGRFDKSVIPAWVADMDFKAPQCVIDSLAKRVEHGIFGYAHPSSEFKQTIKDFIFRHHGWEIQTDWIVFVSGVVPSMNIASKMFNENERVITTYPIYPYFFKAPRLNHNKELLLKMVEVDGRFTLDFKSLREKVDSTCRLFLLCNPYNPCGTVFTKDELLELGEVAKKHDLIICSDEIHCDLVIDKNAKHIPIASLNEDFQNRTITLMAPSKTFNIAGLNCSYAIIPNKALRERFLASMGDLNGGVNILGLEAGKSALEGGDEWLEELKIYLWDNFLLVREFIEKNPKLKMAKHEATFLAWIDCTALKTDPYKLFLKHGVGLTDGNDFMGEGVVRLNFVTQKKNLKEILKRMQKALDSLN